METSMKILIDSSLSALAATWHALWYSRAYSARRAIDLQALAHTQHLALIVRVPQVAASPTPSTLVAEQREVGVPYG
jgi:hypothetical protein